jgi:hypothetical protein
MTSTNWFHPYDPACPPAIAAVALPMLRLASAIVDELPDRPQKWAASIAIGTSNCAGWTLAGIAAKAKVPELELLKGAAKFCQRHNVHPSPYLQRFAAAHAEAKTTKAGAECEDSRENAPQAALEGKAGQ